ncbi:MAG: hypothetical protein CO186_00355 [Zetaproteobacteria bacterium CG_4_9_14_3_um_filter_49_83]|nr:MAG: hypothetical protein AUJ56_13175 [Zetaproteobacteria bacterium CG1_02_49_23]PIQ32004.1 MAG: hypothetical protein COW62_08335 [Zetaproteobacteria bacterium CG17_big_fil_post_rev_8_21_14_2_50_50_13]PIV29673.1 MAG: hypothetical protein COS35_10785 [Zetaproteobacteria bacterium CG02_land_8_20_14_3_00_50_9]PIY56713.1 MAG: hypothetical protein COZ00_02670 [Zetaproteobacteria bacterium CG_4_10_14_0_8_um_filter_49_80]PJA36483.1 MAG: hypothetical protein CO186_00355 [Zetaproteobacteria bacterium
MISTWIKTTLILWLFLPGIVFAATDIPVLDAASFADEVILFNEGSPAAINKVNNSPALALGPPSRKQPSLTLGCGGILIVRFVDNALIDVPGPDLYIFEVGPHVEATKVDISTDASHWLHIGQVAGATASLDIHAYVEPDQSFSFVRLTDLKQSCNSTTPGADISAIGAIGSIARYQFPGDLLFDFDKADLKPEAKHVLLEWLNGFDGKTGRLQINGHTDQMGSVAYNVTLSRQRAQAVAALLQDKVGQKITIETFGLGESQPLVLSTTGEGMAKNRRVEIIYFPQ